jgi:hypothetical protein
MDAGCLWLKKICSRGSQLAALLHRFVPLDWEGISDDPKITSCGCQSRVGLLLYFCRRKALLALPALKRVVEVVNSAAPRTVPRGCWRVLGKDGDKTMSPIEFGCRLKYQLCVPVSLEGSRCPPCFANMDIWGTMRSSVGEVVVYRHMVVQRIAGSGGVGTPAPCPSPWHATSLAGSGLCRTCSIDTFGGLQASADVLLERLQCLVTQVSVAHDGLVWFSTNWTFFYGGPGGKSPACFSP